MEGVKELSKLVQLLGEDNEKKIKDAITNMIIDNMYENINGMSVWLIDFETMFDEIEREIKEDIKKIAYKKYMSKMEKKLDEYFNK